jgi:hypothetical protein
MKRFAILLLLVSPFAFAQDPGWGDARIAFYAQGINTKDIGGSSTYSELVTQFSLNSPFNSVDWDYGIDFRAAGYPGAEARASRVSVYNAFVGRQIGSFGVRAGQIWLNELGSLGSIGGGAFQYKIRKSETNQIRFGAFGGLEPEILDAAYASGVKKFGAYAAVDADQGRNHVIGYVNINNSGLTERSVIVFTNYLPIEKKLYVYQSAEVDLVGPGGTGSGGMNYFFINGRYTTASNNVNVFATYHHGRSIDARSITDDVLNGRPVDPARLNGLLFESFDFRVMTKVIGSFQVFGSYGQDRNNREEQANQRITFGFFTGSIGNTGIDLHFSGNHITPPAGTAYDYWDVSAGKTVGDKVYVSGEYASSVSLVSVSNSNGIILEPGPRATLYGGSALVNVSRAMGLLFTLEHSSDQNYTETRFLGGITYRLSGKR